MKMGKAAKNLKLVSHDADDAPVKKVQVHMGNVLLPPN